MTNLAAPLYIIILFHSMYSMDETTVNRTKSAINSLLDVYQVWIQYAPEYHLSEQDILKLQKKLTKARENIDKIYKTTEQLVQ